MRFRGNVVTGRTSRKKTHKKKQKKQKVKKTAVGGRSRSLSDMTEDALHRYFKSLNGHKPSDLYQLVIGEVEKPLLKAVMTYTNGNQSEAAQILGVNRGTLRKKLKSYELLGE